MVNFMFTWILSMAVLGSNASCSILAQVLGSNASCSKSFFIEVPVSSLDW